MNWYEDKEYWLMCEEAVGIQEKWKKHNGDYYVNKQDIRSASIGDVHIIGMQYCAISGGERLGYRDENVYNRRYPQSRDVWLPSQEDLQEIMRKAMKCDDFSLLTNLSVFVLQNIDLTLSKLWLAFVMHELYGKMWNPESKQWKER